MWKRALRSFNRRMPEEINRVLSDHLSSVLYCPTSAAVENLAREGITAGVANVGDVMYDATLHAAARAREESSILERLALDDGDFAVCDRASRGEHRRRGIARQGGWLSSR